MKVAHHNARVEYGPDYIRIAMTGDHGSARQALRLIDEVADAGRIHPIDLGFAREIIRVWNDYGEGQELQTYVGTRISIDRL